MKSWVNNDPYLRSYSKRILWFAWITGIYFVAYLVFMLVSIFVEISWNFTEPLVAYCVYSIWFNLYNYYQFHRNSVHSEEHRNKVFNDLEKMLELDIKKDYPYYEPFNFRKSRRNVLFFSIIAVVINVALIIMNGGRYWW